MRRRSAADEAGLREGDVLVTVNGRTCDGLSCAQAMDLVESAGHSVVLRVTRLSSLTYQKAYLSDNYYPRESEGLWNHRRWFVCLSVCYHDN